MNRRFSLAWMPLVVLLAFVAIVDSNAMAQQVQPGTIHYFHDTRLPPGVVGQGQLNPVRIFSGPPLSRG